MTLSTRCHPLTALFMALVTLMTSLPVGIARAGMVSTETMIQQEQPAAVQDHRTERERIRDLLARQDVQTEMTELGIAPAEAEARIAALTDQEVAQIAGRLDQLPAGEGIGTILVVIFIVFGIAVLVDALGMMNIFPFVCGPGECGNQVQAYYPEPAAGPAADQRYNYSDRGYNDQTYNDRTYSDRTTYNDRRSSFQRDQFDVYDGRNPEAYDSNRYYEPQAPTRNYYEERFGTQRYVR